MSRSRLHVLRDIKVGVERGRQLPPLRVCEDGNQRLGERAAERLQERGVIEVAPLAYMRGRTLSDAFIILDEAQNTTSLRSP